MKRTIYILLGLALIASSCRSIDKMVERGDYDGAIIFAADKLAGKKNKKTKHVKGLEEAFSKITFRDMQLASRLENSGNEREWDRLIDLYKKIDYRQERIRPLLPLVSKDGYAADFKFVKVSPLIAKATDKAANFHYENAERLLVNARKGTKSDARRAYEAIKKVEKYKGGFLDSDAIRREALYLGKDRILVKVENLSNAILPSGFEREVLSFDVSNMNSLWKTFYSEKPAGIEIDVTAALKIHRLDVGPEREIVNHFVEEKEIVDGWEYVLDGNGNVLKDTLGNDIKVDRKVTIRADIVEIRREKTAIVDGKLEAYNIRDRQLIKSVPINVTAIFEDYASSYRGDKRAICDKTRRRLKSNPLPFPSDIEIVWDSVDELKTEFKSTLKRISL